MAYILDYSKWNRLFEQSTEANGKTELPRLELQQVPEYETGGTLMAEKDGREVKLIIATFNAGGQIVIQNNEAFSESLGNGYNIIGGKLGMQSDFTTIPTKTQFFITNEPYTGAWNRAEDRKGTPMVLDKAYQFKSTVIGTVQLIKMALDANKISPVLYKSVDFKNKIADFIKKCQEKQINLFEGYDESKVESIVNQYIN